MKFRTPSSGQPVGPYIKQTSLWAALISMLNDHQRGALGAGRLDRDLVCQPVAVNTLGKQVERGTLLRPTTLRYAPPNPNAPLRILTEYKASFSVAEPVWHTSIDDIFIVPRPWQEDQVVPIFASRLMVAVVNINEHSKPNDRYAMVDPTTPTELRTSDAGIFQIIGDYDVDEPFRRIAVVDTSEGQPFWRYELKEDHQGVSAPTEIKLLRLDGDEYAPTAFLSDPDGLMADQVTGDRGFCFHSGNKFYAIQAVC